MIESKQHMETIDVDRFRPKTRGDCFNIPRPCPFIMCRYHLMLDWIAKKTPGEKIRFIFDKYSDEQLIDLLFNMPETCALDIADQGEHLTEEIGVYMDISRQRIGCISETKGGAGAFPKIRKKYRAGKLPWINDYWKGNM